MQSVNYGSTESVGWNGCDEARKQGMEYESGSLTQPTVYLQTAPLKTLSRILFDIDFVIFRFIPAGASLFIKPDDITDCVQTSRVSGLNVQFRPAKRKKYPQTL